jgi:tRNA(Ile)-lysidine synthetase-like protein
MNPTFDHNLKKQPALQAQDSLFQDFLKFIRDQELIVQGDSILIAVSGGLDSTVLAFLFEKAAKILKVKVHMAHVDHRTRGLASSQEAEWSRNLGKKINVPVHSLVVPEGIKLNQSEFRSHRRRLLVELAKVVGCNKIATAHHADDNAETFLMRAISGTGINGLRGMAPKDGRWIKPLIRIPRAQLLEYAREHSLFWVEDPSNSRGQYTRNRIRNDFFPMLEEIRQSSVSNLSLVAQRLWEEEEELSNWLLGELDHLSPRTIPLGWLEKWPLTLQRRIFRLWLAKNQLEPNPQLIEELIAGQEVVHAQGVIMKHSDHWVFYPEQDFGSRWAHPLPVELNRRAFLGSSLAWSFLRKSPENFKLYDLSIYLCQRVPNAQENINFCLKWDLVPHDLVVRSIRKDDPKEAHELLSAVQMPKPFRRAWPVLSSLSRPNEIFAVVGVGVLEAYRYTHRGPCLVFECFFEDSLLT